MFSGKIPPGQLRLFLFLIGKLAHSRQDFPGPVADTHEGVSQIVSVVLRPFLPGQAVQLPRQRVDP